MGKITVVIEVVLLALIFQKNPILGLFILVFYIYFKYRKSRFFYNKLIVKAGRRNTRKIEQAIDKGFDKVYGAMIGFQMAKNNSENEILTQDQFGIPPTDSNIYKN